MKDAVSRDSSRNQTSTLIIWSLTELSSFWIVSSEIHTLSTNCGLASLGITSLQAGSGGIRHRELLRHPSQYTEAQRRQVLRGQRLGTPHTQPRCGLQRRQSLPPRPLTQGGGLKGWVMKGLVRVANKTSGETAGLRSLRGSQSPPTNSQQQTTPLLPPLPPPASSSKARSHRPPQGPQCIDCRLQELGAVGCLHA